MCSFSPTLWAVRPAGLCVCQLLLPGGPHRPGAPVLTHFEVGGLQGRTGEQSWKDHVQGDREAPANVSVSNLNVLNLCGISCVAFCTPWARRKHDGVRMSETKQTGQQTLQPRATSTTPPVCSVTGSPFPSISQVFKHHHAVFKVPPRLQGWEPNAQITISVMTCREGHRNSTVTNEVSAQLLCCGVVRLQEGMFCSQQPRQADHNRL